MVRARTTTSATLAREEGVTGTLLALLIATAPLRWDAWCQPVVVPLTYEIPSPAPLYASQWVCPGSLFSVETED
jgi:hypothetical protein